MNIFGHPGKKNHNIYTCTPKEFSTYFLLFHKEFPFLNLNYREIKACELLNRSFQLFVNQLMANPLFYLKKFILGGMSKKNETDWTEIIQKTRGQKVKEFVLLYLKQNFENEKVFDFDVPSIFKKVTYGNLSVV